VSIGQSYQSYILPDDKCYDWTITAEKLHGISRDFLKVHGRNAKDVASELYKFGRGRVFTSDHINDHIWMKKLFESAGLSSLQIEYAPMVDLVADEHADECIKAREEVDKICAKTHAALDDAKYTMLEYQIYYELVTNKLVLQNAMGEQSRQSFSVPEQNN